MLNQFPAKPFLHWAGGKRRILPKIIPYIPRDFDTYVEPFVGGGAVFFYIAQTTKVRLVINDLNPKLWLAYNTIASQVEELIGFLYDLEKEYLKYSLKERKVFFDQTRTLYNENQDNEALTTARFIFLSLTCFNGLCRVDSKGKFSQTFGSGEDKLICDSNNLRAVSEILQRTEILCGDFEETCGPLIDERTFVYLDPPYRPLKPGKVEKYTSRTFNDDDQIRLSTFVRKIDKRGAKFLLSNSDTPDGFFQEHYGEFVISTIEVRRNMSGDPKYRKTVNELLISN